MPGRSLLRARTQRGNRSERGAAALEFALVTPLLVGIIVGIVSYGYMMSFRQGISQGAAEGARAAAVAPMGWTDTQMTSVAYDALNEALGSYGVSCDDTTQKLLRGGTPVGVCSASVVACSNNASRRCARVQVDYAYRDHPLIPSFPGLGASLPEKLDYTAVAEVS